MYERKALRFSICFYHTYQCYDSYVLSGTAKVCYVCSNEYDLLVVLLHDYIQRNVRE